MLLEEYHPTKRHAIKNLELFDLIPMDILDDIYIWLVGIEHIVNIMAVIPQINSPFLCMATYHYWDRFL